MTDNAAHVCADRPQLTITGGISRRQAVDEHGNAFIEFAK